MIRRAIVTPSSSLVKRNLNSLRNMEGKLQSRLLHRSVLESGSMRNIKGITTSSTMNCLGIVLIDSSYIRWNRKVLLNHHNNNNENDKSNIISCSMKVESNSLWSKVKRILRRIQKIAQILKDYLMVIRRTSEIAFRFSPLIVLTPAAFLASNSNSTVVSDIAWNYTLYTIQKLGPSFVKLSQWATTRRDLFPAHICDRLSQLCDATFLHSWKHTENVLKQTFGNNYGDRLKIDRKDVIGSGAVAQVYSATWQDSNRNERKKVAVKVLHPNTAELVERDLQLIWSAAQIIDSLPSKTIRMLSLPRAVQNFSEIMRRQVDLQSEGQNLDQFRENFECKTTETPKVSFPKPIFYGRDCLVEDYIGDSNPINDYLLDESLEGMELRRKLAGPLLRSFLKMVFMDNFVHCDLHPGNVLVRKTSVVKSINWWENIVKTDDEKGLNEEKYTIIFVDAGIVTKLKDKDQQNLKDLFKAVILNNGKEAGRLMVERARYERCSQMEGGIEKFSQGIAEIVNEFHDRRKQGLTLGVVRIGSLLSSVLDLCRLYGVEIDPAMANVVMSTLVLEGLGRALEPDLNLLDIALPFVLGRGSV
mmetsp:Transcript_28351/g.35058  ORF Transcript_28351/g.35058 Transcript_28351/m.35058 type:complete len:588 (-) Transcript_28351:88-1851(-)